VADPDSPAAAIIEALLAEAVPVDEGEFSLDATKAVEKLQRFRYPSETRERDRFLIAMVEGLVGLGATSIVVDRRRGDLEIVADVTIERPGEKLRNLYERLLGAADDDVSYAWSRFAAGLDMELTHERTRRVLIEAPDVGGTVVVLYEPREAPVLRRRKQPRDGIHILIDRSWGVPTMGFDELDRLGLAVTHASIDVQISGDRESGFRRWVGMRQTMRVGEQVLEGGLRHRRSYGSPDLELVSNGVTVAKVSLDDLPTGFECWVELSRPQWDLSQTKLVQDDAYEALVAAAPKLCAEVFARIRAEAEAWGNDELWPQDWDRRTVDGYLGRVSRPAALPEDCNVSVRKRRDATSIDVVRALGAWSLSWRVLGAGVSLYAATQLVEARPITAVVLGLLAVTFAVSIYAAYNVTQSVRLKGGALSLRGRGGRAALRADDIRAIRTRRASTWGEHVVCLDLADGTTIEPLPPIEGDDAADWVIFEIRDALGLKDAQLALPEA
jgi:hypothetical protein